MTKQLTITQPDDWHLHLRDGDMLKAVTPVSAEHFARAIIMPNLVPPVVTEADAVAYRQRIMNALPENGLAAQFEPLMTLYLTEQTKADDVVSAARNNVIKAVKLYPAGATTNSSSGVTNIDKVMPVLEAMAEHGINLCMHGEVTHAEVDIFDREKHFIDSVLDPLRKRLPELPMVLEHVTTKDGVDYIQQQGAGIAGTITTHHLLLNRNHMLVGGIRPHYYCLPIIKRESHREALVAAATSGDARFFLGTDSAPHTANTKENACGCAGVFNAPNTLSCLAHVFELAEALDKLEAFTSLNGPAHYKLNPNQRKITLERMDAPVEYVPHIDVGDERVVVFDPGHALHWRVVTDSSAA